MLKIVCLFFLFISAEGTEQWEEDVLFQHTNASFELPVFQAKQPGEKLTQLKFIRDDRSYSFRTRSYNLNGSGEPVIMLHGFPSSSVMWERSARVLSQNGHRVLAYDQRGYSPGARPEEKTQYNIVHFINDLFSVTNVAGFEKFHLVGHDVGCVVSWVAAALFPDKIKSLSCLSVSHPKTLASKIRYFPPPYLILFGLPSPAAESVLSYNGYSSLQGQYGGFRSSEVEEYKSIFTEPGALTATVNFYREIWSSLNTIESYLDYPIQVPTQFIYGVGEQWVSDKTLEEQSRIVISPTYEVHEVQDAGETGHFVVENQNALVNFLLVKFLSSKRKY